MEQKRNSEQILLFPCFIYILGEKSPSCPYKQQGQLFSDISSYNKVNAVKYGSNTVVHCAACVTSFDRINVLNS